MTSTKSAWEEFVQSEIAALTPVLGKRNVSLQTEQPHVAGERFLMSGKKVVLLATDIVSQQPVIIKSSADPSGRLEIQAERKARRTLSELPFAYHPLLAPQELWCEEDGDRVTVASEFIDQPQPYLALPLIEQFDLIVQAFKMLSGVHAATASHQHIIKNVFGQWRASDYKKSTYTFVRNTKKQTGDVLVAATLDRVETVIQSQATDIERYTNFLTHDDFALHNFRFKDNAIYLIDQASLRFGNKHESWARFLNYMLLYNRDLEKALLQYLVDNAAPEEQRSLRLLRMYKITELLHYHSRAAANSDGAVKTLSERRVTLWHYVLQQLLDNEPVAEEEIAAYKQERDSLRSAEEVARQKALQQLL